MQLIYTGQFSFLKQTFPGLVYDYFRATSSKDGDL